MKTNKKDKVKQENELSPAWEIIKDIDKATSIISDVILLVNQYAEMNHGNVKAMINSVCGSLLSSMQKLAAASFTIRKAEETLI